MLYKISAGEPSPVASTTVVEESLYEKDLEDWVEHTPEILGEPLLMVGRQVAMDDGKDRIDLLAIDKAGSLVIIELKRDLVGGLADIQALRYAALVSKWSHDDLRRQAEDYWKTSGAARGTFTQAVEMFCDEGYEVNADQRVILSGREIKPKLGTMALWLRTHGLDVRVVAISLLRDEDRLYLQPQVVIPIPSEEGLHSKVTIASSDKPWLSDGQAWHLEQRCSPKGRQIVEHLVDLVAKAVPEADGPNWPQKLYVSWRHGARIWARVNTGANQATVGLYGSKPDPAAVAQRLGYLEFQGEAELAEKLALGSNVGLTRDGEGLRITVKALSDLDDARSEALSGLLQEAWLGFTGTSPDGAPTPAR